MKKILLITMMLGCMISTFAQKRIPDYPSVSTVDSSALFLIWQSNANKKATLSTVEKSLGLKDTITVAEIFTSPVFTGTPIAPTAANGTNTNQVATTAFVLANTGSNSTAVPSSNFAEGIRALGGTTKAYTFGINNPGVTSYTMVDGTVYFTKLYLDSAMTIRSITVTETIQGDYTADGYNGIGLYSYNNGTLTLVASSTNNGNLWKTSYYPVVYNLSSPYSATKGMYAVGLLYNSSAQVTAPALIAGTSYSSSHGFMTFGITGKVYTTLAGQSTLPASTTDAACTSVFSPVVVVLK